MAKLMMIYAKQNDSGKWTLRDGAGNEQQEGYEYDTRQDAIDAARQLWPTNSTWQGKSVNGNWQIVID